MTAEQLWNAALGELELELSRANFTTWFAHTTIQNFENGVVVIVVPNAFTKTWLENKYNTNIMKVLRRIADSDIHAILYKVISSAPLPLKTVDNALKTQKQASKNSDFSIAPPKDETDRSSSTQPTSSPVFPLPLNTSPASPEELSFDEIGLNPRYTFENFVVGKKNELAHATCLAVSDKPGTAYNPVFIYGGVGLGKTHLMQAVGHVMRNRESSVKILYVSCETFTNEFIKAIGSGHADEFQNKYRTVDILMVDDIQFLAGKEGTQEAFFHTFNHLHQRNRQIILTSDRPPRAIPSLEQRLVSRFEGGMIVDVSAPDLETRIAILRRKCEQKGFGLSDEVAQYIAANVQNNIRELEGVLNRVIVAHELRRETPTVAGVRELLASYTPLTRRGALTMRVILKAVADFYGLGEEEVASDSRKRELVFPRQVAMYLMREVIHASYPNIGQEVGGRDHTTAMYAYQRVVKDLQENEKTQSDISIIRERLNN